MSRVVEVTGTLGGLIVESETPLLDGGAWYRAGAEGDGLTYSVRPGELAKDQWLWADMLLDGDELAVFRLTLEQGDGKAFYLHFGVLNQAQARLRLPLAATDLNRWGLEREGAWLKPLCYGDRIDPAHIERITLTVLRKGDNPVRWCQSPLRISESEPPELVEPLLPKGPLLDELGQSVHRNWPGKSKSAEEVVQRLCRQRDEAPAMRWPAAYSRWGGWQRRRADGAGAPASAISPGAQTGFFRTYHDGHRWWLVDPDGYLFWSSGVNCVRVDTDAAYKGLEAALSWMPDREDEFRAIYTGGRRTPTINYLAANLIRSFGPEKWYDTWAEIALAHLRSFGFNTVANWSDWEIARAAHFPYVRPLHPGFERTPKVFRDFPDVFHPEFEKDAAREAQALAGTASDPALIGYFLMNEPTWGFASESPAAAMLYTAPECESRKELARFLRERYPSDEALAAAWGMDVTFANVEQGAWQAPLTEAARRDLDAFSSVMVERFFRVFSEACKAVDPNHLNLGVRYYTVPPSWAMAGMRHFDVFSLNCYRERIPHDAVTTIARELGMPVIIGEWHFGALDVGLPATGIGRVKDQAERGKAFRIYVEDAAADPNCVGVHYFTLYDQSALGRFDGENYNIGFLDVCNRPYEPLAEAARQSHERLYEVAAGDAAPYNDAPEYLPKLFL